MAEAVDLREVLRQWPVSKLIALIVVFVLTVAGIAGMVFWGQSLDYQVLYSNLDREDTAAVCDRLAEMKVPYRIEGGGTAVLVPTEQVYELRMKLAQGGLPQGGGVGFEILDESKLGMTEFLQKVNFRRALQGELARTIRQLNEVSAARVHLSIPEKTIFRERQEPTKASVVVSLRSGRSLSRPQVQGIVRLVASSVEGLGADHVTVLNSAGELLSSPQEEEGAAATASQNDYRRGVAREYESRIQSMLDSVLGDSRSIVRVDVDLDFRRVERTEEKYDPDAVAVRTEARTKDKSSGTTAGGGIPGVLSNTPGATQAVPQGGSNSAEKQKETINYEISKVINRIIEPSGIIKRLSVAVMVDGTYTTGDDGKATYVPRTPDELGRYEELVKTAVGFQADRGDQLVLTNVPFHREEVEEIPEEGADLGRLLPMIMKYVIPVIAMLLGFLLVLKPLVRAVQRTPVAPKAPPAIPQTAMSQGASAVPGGSAPTALSRGEERAAPQTQILEHVQQKPDQAASILREWMSEE